MLSTPINTCRQGHARWLSCHRCGNQGLTFHGVSQDAAACRDMACVSKPGLQVYDCMGQPHGQCLVSTGHHSQDNQGCQNLQMPESLTGHILLGTGTPSDSLWLLIQSLHPSFFTGIHAVLSTARGKFKFCLLKFLEAFFFQMFSIHDGYRGLPSA